MLSCERIAEAILDVDSVFNWIEIYAMGPIDFVTTGSDVKLGFPMVHGSSTRKKNRVGKEKFTAAILSDSKSNRI